MKKILTIEDDATLQQAIKTCLERNGLKVIQATNGEEGIQKAKQEKPDLILLDLILPEKDGYHVIFELQKKPDLKKIPIIILTVIDSKTSHAECKCYGAVDYIIKSDTTIDEVVNKIKKHLK